MAYTVIKHDSSKRRNDTSWGVRTLADNLEVLALALVCIGYGISRNSYFLDLSFLMFTMRKMRITMLLILESSCKDIEYYLQIYHGFMFSSLFSFLTVFQMEMSFSVP